MQTVQLLSILDRPWMIEPGAAQRWAAIAADVIYHGKPFTAVADVDRRNWYRDFYRVTPQGKMDDQGCLQVINVHGPMSKYGFCGSAGTQQIQQAVRAADNDPSICAIVMEHDSPGGQVDGTDNLAREVSRCTKPVVTFVNGMMCSASYWVGCCGDEIIVDSANDGYNAMIGSIGTMAMWKDYSKAEKKIGIVTHMVTADASADKNKMFERANAGDYSEIKDILNALNNTFLDAVKTNRAGKLSKTENVLSGKTYNGRDAVKYGLADWMGNFQMAVSRAFFLSKNAKK